jgi:hypothetical protein
MQDDWEEAFDSPLLWFLLVLSMGTWFAVFLFGNVGAAFATLTSSTQSSQGAYILFLMIGTVASAIVYLALGGLPDWKETIEVSNLTLGTGIGFGAVVIISVLVSGALSRVTSAIWVPASIITLAAGGPPNGQVLLDIVILGGLVAPAERGLVAIGAIFTKATHIGENLPLYAQPGLIAFTSIWAYLHVAFGQYPPWFFFVALPAGEGMLLAADLAGDYVAAVFTHGAFDVTVRILRFLTTGM